MNKSEQTESSAALVTVNEAAKYLSLGRTALYQLMERGELGYCKLGKARRIPRAEIERLISSSLVRR